MGGVYTPLKASIFEQDGHTNINHPALPAFWLRNFRMLRDLCPFEDWDTTVPFRKKKLPMILQLPESPFKSHNGAWFRRSIFLHTMTSLNGPSVQKKNKHIYTPHIFQPEKKRKHTQKKKKHGFHHIPPGFRKKKLMFVYISMK